MKKRQTDEISTTHPELGPALSSVLGSMMVNKEFYQNQYHPDAEDYLKKL
jgi:hypothetical protein